MFGREYANHPEILLSSFKQINSSYKKIAKNKNNSLLQKLYLLFFGIPEIGFQIRSLYFDSIINKNLSEKKLLKILDAGSGIGTYAFWLAKKFPNAKIIGGEIDEEKINFSKKFAEDSAITNIEFKKFDVTKNISKKNEYDFVVNIDVLEHIEDYKKVIKNFYNLIAPRGYLYIHTPQPDQKRIFKQFYKWFHEDHAHEGYAPVELKKELQKLGFKVLILRETFGFWGKLSWELNHMSFKKGFVVAGLVYPILYLVALIDLLFLNKNGLGTALLAQKK